VVRPSLLALAAVAALCATAPAVSAGPATPSAAHVGPRPLVSAHRGGAAYEPENTMAAFRNAVRLHVDQLETDTQLTKDGKLVLIHDDTLDRTTNCHGAVQDSTYAAIRKCGAAYWFTPGVGPSEHDPKAAHPLRGHGVRVPLAATLFRYVRSIGRRAPQISIEIKDIPGEANFDADAEPVARDLVTLIHRLGRADTLVQSFYPPALDAVKGLDPRIRTQLLSETTASYALAYAVARGHDVVAPDSGSPDLSPTFVRAAHVAGKLVIVWTPDARTDQVTAFADGVDGVISNWPACTLELEQRAHPAPGFGLPDCPR
jgi:glycerophosphoryl diester phosphodiesterase